MKKKLKYLLTFVWFCYLIVTSVLLFTKGFLLTREVMDNNSTCTLIEKIMCQYEADKDLCLLSKNNSLLEFTFDKASHLCLKPHLKVILIVIDALRFDFTQFNENIDNPLPYENKLPVIKNTISKFPNSTRLYRFIADPPTTTMQRLKALTTGSLPTFIDAGSNFATSEINEDNIIDQILKNNYSAVFMGDDTWTSLYPRRFLRNYPYPSFNVWDLDTVDNGVKTQLFAELKNSDWNLLIGHFLGVDHCGHRYGPNHSEMSRKLSEMNDVLENVIDVMDENSILFVIGDHGMTATGDHGGESVDEISAAMFVHSKRPLLSFDINRNSVKQVDLVPTLSAILGIPIPFQNLGLIISDCIPKSEESVNNSNSWQLSLFWLWGNVQQIIKYIKTYSEKTDIFNEEYLNVHYNEFQSLGQEILMVNSKEEYLLFSQKATEFIIRLRTLCEEVWIQFDSFSISNGLTFLFLSIFYLFILSDGIPFKHLPGVIEGSFVSVCCIGLLLTTIAVTALSFSKSGMYTSIFITNILSHFLFLLPVFQNWSVISINWYNKNKTYVIIYLLCSLILFFNVCGLFSNSFINEEASVLLFLLVTIISVSMLIIALFLRIDHNSKRKTETFSKDLFFRLAFLSLIILGFLRMSMYFWRCRVEQEWCFASPQEVGSHTLKLKSSKLQWGVSVIALAILVSFNKLWLKKCGNLSGYSITEMFTNLVPTVIVVCTAGFWVLIQLPSNKFSKTRTINYLALSVYGLSVLSIIGLIVKPLCVIYFFKNKKDISSPKIEEDVIPHIYNKLKINFNKDSKKTENIPIVCGLGTAYSAVYIILGTYLSLLVALVLGDIFAFSIVIMWMVTSFMLVTTSILRIRQADSIEDLFSVPSLAVLGWIVLAQYFFYATGHQPAFSNIAWESAFVGTSGLFTNNYVLGALIILNTFGSYILMGILLPLLIIAPFTLFVMMPSVLGKQKEFYKFSERGELMLFEKDQLATSALFSLSCKYIAGHAIKVFVSMLAATVHCRHLMVWNVFAPKFIFEGIAMFITIGSVLLGYLLFLRIHSQVERLVDKLNKAT